MNFINPYTSIYFCQEELRTAYNIPFYKEVIWVFLKCLDNRLKLFKHRVNIHISDREELLKTRRFGSIYEYFVRIDQNTFTQLDEPTKRSVLLDVVHRAFLELADCHGWDKEAINSAYEHAKREGLYFYSQTKSKTNRSKSLTASLHFELTGNTLTFSSHITDLRNGSVQKVFLLKTDEDHFSWWRRIKDFGWYDNQRFGLKLLNGELWIVNNTASGEIEEIINQNKKEIKEINQMLFFLKEPPFIPR
ncbi:hypothetical protein [Sabulibacter ruber]|uniref:hypothetical protein n=1 Tax=Sabulibacter ruber TaxID=2811901 RepID=UPI001A95B4A9|nr:hypothetical protein [Sabulibacter ruber]